MAEIHYSFVLRSNPTDYVYEHFHPQRITEVVYVGRGSDGRAWSSACRSHDHLVWIREWQALGYSPDRYVRIVSGGLTPQQAVEQERELIVSYGQKGVLLFNELFNTGEVRRHANRFHPDGPRRDTDGRWAK